MRPMKSAKSRKAAGGKRPKATRRQGAAGRPFKPGKNSHTDEVHRRGPDILARGSMKKLYDWFLADNGSMAEAVRRDRSGSPRVILMQSLLKIASKPGGMAMLLAREIADRVEGKPVQSVRIQEPRTTIFQGPGMGEQ